MALYQLIVVVGVVIVPIFIPRVLGSEEISAGHDEGKYQSASHSLEHDLVDGSSLDDQPDYSASSDDLPDVNNRLTPKRKSSLPIPKTPELKTASPDYGSDDLYIFRGKAGKYIMLENDRKRPSDGQLKFKMSEGFINPILSKRKVHFFQSAQELRQKTGGYLPIDFFKYIGIEQQAQNGQ